MPASMPVAVTVTSPVAREMPKSVILTVPSSPSRTLPGLMSRCTMPALCAAASAEATCMPIEATSRGGSVPRSDRTADRLFDGRYSITSHGWPSSSATSYTATACGCCRRAAMRPSRMARLLASSTSPSASPGCRSSCLTATVRCRRSSCAVQTTPMAPLPMRWLNR
ncbi:hypothetical protein BBK82_18080 [Lentzea guizhouensis]|uniref:Uncharacterized protein n=1 Tax=Lentzea guizhouensis TaxID=1586287 RepID=A0A1B2HIW5_9PSEU|nr:hypothetical protein BBK82_18080 [Lentzea guizhouensis]